MTGTSLGTAAFGTGTTDISYPNVGGFKTDSRNFNLSLTPSYGVFFNNRTVAGITFLLNTSYQKLDQKTLRDTIYSSSRSNNTDIGLGLFLRHYLSTTGSLLPFLQFYVNGGTGFGKTSGFAFGTDVIGDYREDNKGETTKRFFINTGLNAGISRMITPAIGFEVFAGYALSQTKFTSENISIRKYNAAGQTVFTSEPTQRFKGHGINLGLGFQLFISRK